MIKYVIFGTIQSQPTTTVQYDHKFPYGKRTSTTRTTQCVYVCVCVCVCECTSCSLAESCFDIASVWETSTAVDNVQRGWFKDIDYRVVHLVHTYTCTRSTLFVVCCTSIIVFICIYIYIYMCVVSEWSFAETAKDSQPRVPPRRNLRVRINYRCRRSNFPRQRWFIIIAHANTYFYLYIFSSRGQIELSLVDVCAPHVIVSRKDTRTRTKSIRRRYRYARDGVHPAVRCIPTSAIGDFYVPTMQTHERVSHDGDGDDCLKIIITKRIILFTHVLCRLADRGPSIGAESVVSDDGHAFTCPVFVAVRRPGGGVCIGNEVLIYTRIRVHLCVRAPRELTRVHVVQVPVHARALNAVEHIVLYSYGVCFFSPPFLIDLSSR
jgi:hypothetical protein